jgi:RNA recognition motif-containing protein
MNIYVGNLNYRLKEEELREAFEAIGAVDSVKLVKDRETGRAKGFGFIEMPNEEEALAAIEKLNGSEVGDRQMVVKEARPKNQD